MFTALSVESNGKRNLLQSNLVLPGKTNLFEDLREIGKSADIGRYRRLDLDPDSKTHGFHLFERGIVRLASIFLPN